MLGSLGSLCAFGDALETGFATMPAQTQPWCYYYWVSDNISKEGITKDLEAMKRFGIGEALIGNIFLDNQPAGRIKVLSEEWWSLVEHTIREGGRLGVNIGLFNCPGWSQSGGPWITPEQTMRYLASSETRVTGPKKFSEKLSAPNAQFQDVAVLAYPAPENDAETLTAKSAKLSVEPAQSGIEALTDGKLDTSFTLGTGPAPKIRPVTVSIALDAPLTARSLQIFPSTASFSAECDLQADDGSGKFVSVRKFKCDRSNPNANVGAMTQGPVTLSFPATTAKNFRLVFSNFSGRGAKSELAEINLSGASRLEAFVEKQLGKMHPTPMPTATSYVWKTQPEPESPKLAVASDAILNLSSKLSTDGTLTWDVPAGDWVIQRTGMTPTGMKNAPASPEGQGLEVDKMNRQLAQQHFDTFVGELLRRMPAADRKAFTQVVGDSYEMGSQNWTDGLAEVFKKEFNYDPTPWLPVLSGRIVGSASQSERFLWDLRRLIADRIATEYVGGLKESANKHGLGLWLENYGHWGFPGEFLKYGGQSDRIAGEFWVTGDLGAIECRAASSAGNAYGKPFISAESFTGGPPFQTAPADMKARGDWSFCEGINHVVLHVYIQQPDNKIPGINAPWGTEFNRHNTWFEKGRTWADYERRACWMLQQGFRATDVAYFIGEDAPKMTGEKVPPLPAGRDFDYINAEVIERDLSVKDGLLVLPHGVSYKVLVLPNQKTMRPAVLEKIRDLVKAGATILGAPPTESPSLQDFPKADSKVRALAQELWGDADVKTPGERTFGKGKLVWGKNLVEFFESAHSTPDIEYRGAPADANFLFTHRTSPEAEIYFITNQKDRDEKIDAAFRIKGRQPELWDAVTGECRVLPEWSQEAEQTVVPLAFAPKQSWFIVFRKPGSPVAGGKNFPELSTLATIDGAWDVSFDPKWGGPEKVSFTELSDWITRPEEGIKFYSGTATYWKTFEITKDTPLDQALLLDLGKVRDVATIKLNGKELGTLWITPYRLDISKAAKLGSNTLEIEVINPWNNRLIGDSELPVEKRLTSISLNTLKPKSPLQSAGLMGPVTLQAVKK
jgi:hypothetical protein